MTKTIGGVIVAVLVVISVFIRSGRSSTDATAVAIQQEKQEDLGLQENNQDDEKMEKAETLRYETYTSSTDFSQIVDEDIVLFFHADRCPTCNNIQDDIYEKGVPEGLRIFKVDFDEEKELLEKYNVLTQSSFAQIDNQGNLIKRRVGGFGIDDIVEKINDTEVKPRELKRAEAEIENGDKKEAEPKAAAVEESASVDALDEDEQKAVIIQNEPVLNMLDTSADDVATVPDTATAYFAGGCFRCIEGPFEAMDGVKSAVSGYAEGAAETASYTFVGRGDTKHREAVMVTYDPMKVSYAELVQTFRYQIDPTDAGGQFADRGYQYTTAIYYQSPLEQSIAQESKDTMNLSGKFDDPIAVLIRPFTTFFEAEEEHQDYYLKQSSNYQRYKKGSGRAGFIDETWKGEGAEGKDEVEIINEVDEEIEVVEDGSETLRPSDTSLENGGSEIDDGRTYQGGIGEAGLDEMQRKVVFDQGTEPPFDNLYRDHKEAGIYVDILDGTPLFSSTDKFDSGTGWPSFTTPIDALLIELEEDKKFGMVRTEVETANDTHLGHVFNDGPGGSQRYCINSAALDFVALEDMEEMGYSDYLVLFE